MDQILIAWIGGADIDASLKQQHGLVSATLQSAKYSHVYLLYNYSNSEKGVPAYLGWLKAQTKAVLGTTYQSLDNPQDLGEIYREVGRQRPKITSRYFSAGSPFQITTAMQALSISLGKTKYLRVTFCKAVQKKGYYSIRDLRRVSGASYGI